MRGLHLENRDAVLVPPAGGGGRFPNDLPPSADRRPVRQIHLHAHDASRRQLLPDACHDPGFADVAGDADAGDRSCSGDGRAVAEREGARDAAGPGVEALDLLAAREMPKCSEDLVAEERLFGE